MLGKIQGKEKDTQLPGSKDTQLLDFIDEKNQNIHSFQNIHNFRV